MNPISKSIAIHAAPSRVWQVLTRPDDVRVWLSDSDVEVRSDWEVGSAISYDGNWHGFDFIAKGLILELEPDKVFAYRFWSNLSQFPDEEAYYTTIRLDLSAAGPVTTLHANLDNLVTPENHGHWNFYWAMALDRIRRLAETGAL